ncbi:fimbrillin family protein [Bacteroides thetaiotaomicron]|uniref:fimbrillin family protein n=1 Tax=Bacteroides thetaiotaomicron TaxID=818 RepID=UPI003564F62C
MKKRNNYPYHHAAALLLPVVLMVLVGACTADDGFVPSPGEAPATSAPPLTITVTDGAYAPAPTANDEDVATAPATRAVERGFGTDFTAGDKIGLYEVIEKERSDGKLIYQVITKNLCLTYNGTAWALPEGAKLTPERQADGSRTRYYAYYPWQKDMADKVVGDDGIFIESPTGKPWTPREFFGPLIDNWQPASDQSTYAAYTASDLMVSRGTVTQRTDGADGSELRFEMEHQMALAVVRVPSTEYTYTETVSGSETKKSYRLYTGMNTGGWWQENSHTARLLVNPQYGTTLLMGYYYTAELKKCSFSVTTVGRGDGTPGTYRLYTIDGGKAEVKERSLKEGDFYMRDGSILPQEAADAGSLPAKVQADCLGVVFWVGENEGRHWTQTKYFYGDYLLMRDHPECTRGMAVALRDASPTAAVWATGEGAGTYLYDWGKGFSGFTHAEQADWEAIDASGAGYGYCRSRLMKLYGAHYPATTFPAYNQIDTYAAAHPAPDGSSGWFFPGQRELAMMCYGMTGNFSEKPTTRRNLLNGLFPKAGGEAFDGRYWSNFEDGTNAWTIDFAGSTAYGNKSKSDTHKVRAVIAF